MSGLKRITERSNDLTKTIDSGSPEDIMQGLSRSDEQIFNGFEQYDSILSPTIVTAIEELTGASAKIIEDTVSGRQDNAIVLTGCGTSGRMAWLCARTFNKLLEEHGMTGCFKYCISGGDEALIVSKELPEDSPTLGLQDLQQRIAGKDRVLVVGITCGLSAPYVAGQLDWALGQDHVIPCLMGFNPVSIARDDSVENWSKTCRQVFSDVQSAAAAASATTSSAQQQGSSAAGPAAFVLNPVVGPEPITGSTRMKGGSATKILLEIVFLQAIERALQSCGIDIRSASGNDELSGEPVAKKGKRSSPPSTANAVSLYRETSESVYRSSLQVAGVLQSAAQSISQPDGHLYYLGSDSFALLGLVDASEMVDTFGAARDEVRGFVDGGWHICANNQGDLSSAGKAFRMSLEHFNEDIVDTLSANDTVVLLSGDSLTESVSGMWNKIVKSPAALAHVTISASNNISPVADDCERECKSVTITLPFAASSTFDYVLRQFALKLVLNAISTGANILKGRVFGNTMVNLSLSNNKLYYRSASIVQEMASVSDGESLVALHRSIYRDQPLALEGASEKLVSEHIRAGKHQAMVVPLAILLASKRYREPGPENIGEAMAQLFESSSSSLRQVLQTCQAN